MTLIQKIGLSVFVLALGLLMASLWMGDFQLKTDALQSSLSDEYQYGFID